MYVFPKLHLRMYINVYMCAYYFLCSITGSICVSLQTHDWFSDWSGPGDVVACQLVIVVLSCSGQ